MNNSEFRRIYRKQKAKAEEITKAYEAKLKEISDEMRGTLGLNVGDTIEITRNVYPYGSVRGVITDMSLDIYGLHITYKKFKSDGTPYERGGVDRVMLCFVRGVADDADIRKVE